MSEPHRLTLLEAADALAAVFTTVDVVLSPSQPIPTPPAAVMSTGGNDPEAAEQMRRFTAPYDMSGSPTLSLPAGVDANGLPLGFQLIGPALGESAAFDDEDARIAALLRRPPTAVDNMSARHPFIQITSAIAVSPEITAHSIIPVTGSGPYEHGTDGVVAYESAHVDWAASEKVVRWNHSCQGTPVAIEEVRRILYRHAAEADAANAPPAPTPAPTSRKRARARAG
ncbi:MAG: hypothetical protein IT293_13685 [Deltaproteobacteria bacterium]|nr:hypothetical protein [Deltaproteobacteria bacterium]